MDNTEIPVDMSGEGMTDKKRLMSLFDDFGIEYEQIDNAIKIETGDEGKIIGYRDFYSEYIFYEDGKFAHIGMYK